MNIIVIGLGSMGRRRIRLLQMYDESVHICGVDMQEGRRKQAEKELGIETKGDIETACKDSRTDMAFISTSPLSHAAIIRECLNRNLHVFTELNLTDKEYDANIRLAKEKGRILFLSSTFLYRKEVQYIKNAVKNSGCRLSYLYHAGQYLPDWHPWESYRNFFVGNKETNGCREFMAIEFPWLLDTFGDVKELYSISSKNSTLDIDFPDSYRIMLEHESGHQGMISIDIVSRKAVRNFELSGEKLYLTSDGTPDGLVCYDYEKKSSVPVSLYESVNKRADYSASIIEDAYLSEIINFMDAVKGKADARYSFEKDKRILSIIDKIEGRQRK